MIKTLMGSIRDYMKVAVATPLLVLGEVLCEMLIPFITANLIDAIKDGTTVAEMLPTAGFLVLIALTSLAFGAAAGVTCSHGELRLRQEPASRPVLQDPDVQLCQHR